ncbi:MAG: methylmalonyl Co-A mutase-associated GTPase MeaB [Planctomycetota bacterium]|nr:methylmalonyl Co-A mutase-associated GTPase MeaB [Planctomycetota bacterium]
MNATEDQDPRNAGPHARQHDAPRGDSRGSPGEQPTAFFGVSVAKAGESPGSARATSTSNAAGLGHSGQIGSEGPPPGGAAELRRPRHTPEQLASGVLRGDRSLLGRAISLVESTNPRHAPAADELLRRVLSATGKAIRVGVTGVPGAGKSTFIEKLGLLLCGQGRRVAVLAIDPSSVISGGSILGDRTRMGKLALEPRAFIRPSPSGGTLGGVARRTREVSLVCEAAGFDVVLVETVGVGQSETLVAEMVDCVLTLALPGSGDELQGVKRGLLEVVDVVAVNKADGDNAQRARLAATELASAMHVLRGAEHVPVVLCSALTGDGVADAWQAVIRRYESLRSIGVLDERRTRQRVRWLHELLDDRLRALLHASPGATRALRAGEDAVRALRSTPSAETSEILAMLVADLRRSDAKLFVRADENTDVEQ